MEILDAARSEPTGQLDKGSDLDFVFSILAGEETVSESLGREQRVRPRIGYRVSAVLQRTTLEGEGYGQTALLHVYLRDINARGVGFVSRERVRVARDALLHLPLPEGQVHHVGGWILRCREVLPGWYEGAVLFDREQPEFSPEQILAATSRGRRACRWEQR